MAEYIEREALLGKIDDDAPLNWTNSDEEIQEQWDYRLYRSMVADAPAADVVEIPQSGIGDLSDGYHTFNELYHHRAILFSVICNLMPDKAWKSKLHDTGDMYDGMFIVGIKTSQGQATYHYDIDPYWDMFKVKELEKAPKWDGHTPQDAIERIAKLGSDVVEVRHGEWETKETLSEQGEPQKYSHFHKECKYYYVDYGVGGHYYCPNCGAKMDGKDGAECPVKQDHH